ncbi:hypothetical protein Tco_0077284 [Tanacetum coccineum]
MFVIKQPLPAAPAADSNAQVLSEWNALYDAYNEVACLMLGSMTSELHRQFENYSPYEMLQDLKSMFEKQARVERFDLIQTFHACKQEEGKPIAAYVLQMKEYIDQLERNGYSRKRAKRKPKASNSKHGVEEGKVKRDQTANSPKKSSFPPHTFSSAKPLLSLAKSFHPPYYHPPSCIKAMLAIPHLSQVSSMAKIDSKEAQMKSKAGICFGLSSHNKHTSFLLSKEAQAASPKLRL